ncbi:hypothetical protein ANN_16487 [Periplaneta americana]|uniref:Uncharacterized protein n=1 Tax=Periplaneta americana TaxID=6978 RepID=A0ABQ8SK86_PERAM|nr:hypothetical protein ANN_16487 [Periplaneta americana]
MKQVCCSLTIGTVFLRRGILTIGSTLKKKLPGRNSIALRLSEATVSIELWHGAYSVLRTRLAYKCYGLFNDIRNCRGYISVTVSRIRNLPVDLRFDAEEVVLKLFTHNKIVLRLGTRHIEMLSEPTLRKNYRIIT